jgi:hypothetical protein
MAKDKLAKRLELHYFFSENDLTHSMDAVVRNKYEFLQIINTIAIELNIKLITETEASEVGGLKEFYSFISSPEGKILTEALSIILPILMARTPPAKSKLDKLEQQLNIEEKIYNREKNKIKLELLKNTQSRNFSEELCDYLTTNDSKILKHKSNFFKTLHKYPKVKRLSLVNLDENNQPIDDPKFIERCDFEKFILENDILEPVLDENAIIQIISPVLKKGKYKWRGIYDKLSQPIEFFMKDKVFEHDILKDKISFKNGTFIECVLEISKKIDETGCVVSSSYSVLTVIRHNDDGVSIETPQGKRFRQIKKSLGSQMKLFGNSDESV